MYTEIIATREVRILNDKCDFAKSRKLSKFALGNDCVHKQDACGGSVFSN